MKVLTINNDTSFFSQEQYFNGVQYTFEFTWNNSGKYWMLDIYNDVNTPLILGIKILTASELFTMWVDRGLPGTPLYCIAANGSFDDIEFLDLYNNVQLLIYN